MKDRWINPESFPYPEELPKELQNAPEKNGDSDVNTTHNEQREFIETSKLEKFVEKLKNTSKRLVNLTLKLNEQANDQLGVNKLIQKWDNLSSLKQKVYIISFYTTMIMGGIEVNLLSDGYALTKNRYQVRKVEKFDKKKGRSVEYEHEDAQTTHILNVIAGKESFTDHEVQQITSAYIRKQSKILNPELAANEDMSEQELAEMYEQLAKKEHINDPTFYALDRNYWKSKPMIKEKLSDQFGADFDQKLYQTLWQILEEAGNPKIRLVFEKTQPRERANYSAEENTMYLYPEDLDGLGQFIAESSHGKQFQEHPHYNTHRRFLDDVIVLAKGLLTNKDYRSTYDETLYELPGSIEHEAHSVIEPTLRKKIPESKATPQQKTKKTLKRPVKKKRRR